MIKKWKRHSSKILADYYIFKAYEHVSESPITGKTHSFFTLNASNWANVIASTKDNKLVMTRQYRHGIHDITLEFPAGTLESKDKNIAQTAARELLEETGYRSTKNVKQIGIVDTNPAFLNNKCYTFLIKDVTRDNNQYLDETEDIEVEEIPISDIPSLINKGQITHSLSIAAFYFYSNNLVR